MDFPHIFSIETVLGCNLHCIGCAIGSNIISRKYGMMSFNQFNIIAEKMKKYCTYAYLHLWGEPMLNPDIIKIIEIASKFTRTNISTNANSIDKIKAKQLIHSGVSDIIVSIDGMTQNIYNIYRRGGSLEKAILGLMYLVRYNILGKKKISITPQFIVFEHNKHEMKQFEQFCFSLGISPVFKAPYIRHGSILKNSGNPFYERKISDDIILRKENMKLCNINNVFTILLDGSVVACCYDHNGITTFGNIFKDSVDKIWTSEKFTKFRESISNGTPPPFCLKNCLLY